MIEFLEMKTQCTDPAPASIYFKKTAIKVEILIPIACLHCCTLAIPIYACSNLYMKCNDGNESK